MRLELARVLHKHCRSGPIRVGVPLIPGGHGLFWWMGLTILGYQHWWSELAELASSYVITHSLTHSLTQY